MSIWFGLKTGCDILLPVESAVEPLHSAADPAGSGAALTESFCLCVRV
jgi:hypothetical protein